jgi:hypothetical protein
MSEHHVLMGKRVPVDKYDTDHLLRLILKISKRCHKFALKHSKGEGAAFGDDGVWVARGFVKAASRKAGNGGRWELSTIDTDPLVVAEKFLTMLNEHYERYGIEES